MNILFLIKLFFVGMLESFLLGLNTKFLQHGKKLACMLVSIISVFIWYYVLVSIIENLNQSFSLICSYAIGYGYGDVWALRFSDYLERIAKLRGIKNFRKRFHKKIIRRKKR